MKAKKFGNLNALLKRRVVDVDPNAVLDEVELTVLFERYNTNGVLERDCIRSLLEDCGPGAVSDQDAKTVASMVNPVPTGKITRKDMPILLKIWRTFQARKPVLDETLQKFDTDHTGYLDKAQLKELLKAMNKGGEVTEEEVAWVFEGADTDQSVGINKIQLLVVTTMWNQYLSENEAGRRRLLRSANGLPCCSVQ